MWPEDARDVSYSANQVVPSDNLNEIQDRIVDLHRQHVILLREAEIEEWDSGSGHYRMGWRLAGSNPEWGWECQNNGEEIRFPLAGLRTETNPVRISRVRLKVYNSGTPAMVANLYKMDMQFDAAATAPALGSSLASDTATTANWEVLELTPASPIELTADALVMVCVTSAVAAERIAAVEVTLLPIKPTP